MSPTLPSSCRRRRALPPHGYEGRRAESKRVPVFAATAVPALPAPEVLTGLGIRFEPVGLGGGTVRVWHRKFSLGVFISQAAAAAVILRLIQQ